MFVSKRMKEELEVSVCIFLVTQATETCFLFQVSSVENELLFVSSERKSDEVCTSSQLKEMLQLSPVKLSGETEDSTGWSRSVLVLVRRSLLTSYQYVYFSRDCQEAFVRTG